MDYTDTDLPSILLASSSPRREHALRALGFSITVLGADVDESSCDNLPIARRVVALAELKLRSVLDAPGDAATGMDVAVGADTLVSIDGKALGKAASAEEARSALELLSGRTHLVSTGLCVADMVSGVSVTALSETRVSFARLSDEELDWYVAGGEWRGAAGSYRIQDHASFFVDRMEGSFSGVVGLPLREFYAILRGFGYACPMGSGA
ncbi:MAG: septum formation protein Maf, partial [Spirochaetales bacterium]|nr:septum formation protein Maf [Spirochaetales bacterium]